MFELPKIFYLKMLIHDKYSDRQPSTNSVFYIPIINMPRMISGESPITIVSK